MYEIESHSNTWYDCKDDVNFGAEFSCLSLRSDDTKFTLPNL